MKFMDLINEEKNRKFDFGCAMLYFTFPELSKIQEVIKPDHLYEEEDDASFGLEDEPHVTLLYGFHPQVTTKQIVKILDKRTFYTVKLHNPSLFKNEKYDVLKFDVEGDSLHDTNEELKKFPHTTNFPDYHPHVTVAYLKPGYGKRYVAKLKTLKDFWVAPQHAIYSKIDGTKDKISIKVD